MLATVRRGNYRRLGSVGSSVGSLIGLSTGAGALATAGISAGVSLAAFGIQAWLSSIQLSHEADTATTQIVNGLEPKLRANLAAFQAAPQTQCNQQVALEAFDVAWNWLISSSGCGNGAYGSAGNRCVSDRSRGGQWDWASYYRDPIATASVTPGTACPGTTVSGSGQSTDLDNDLQALLPGSASNYFALINAAGSSGVIGNPSSGAAPAASPTPTVQASLLGGFSNTQLFVAAAALILGVWVVSR